MHSSNVFRFARTRATTLLCCAILVVLTNIACSSGPKQPTVSDDIAAATGTARGAICFQIEGGATDVEPDDDAGILSLAYAVHASLMRDPRVQMSLARVRAALADAKQARLLPNPVLNVALRFPEGGGKLAIDMGLSADLISLLRQPAQRRAADARLRAAAADAVVVALDVVAEVEQTYAEAQALDADVNVINEQVKLNDRLLQLAKDRLEAGESSQLDVLTLETRSAELATEAIQRQADARDKRLVLARLIGAPSGDAEWKLDETNVAVEAMSGDERVWIAAALEHRPEAQSRCWELAALGEEVSIAVLGVFDGAEVGADAERDDGEWSVGPAFSLPIPFLDWGQERKNKAQAQRIEARHRTTETRRQVVEDVRRAIARLNAAQAAAGKVRSELLPAQQRRHEQAEDAYKAGSVDVTTFIIAQQDLQATRAKLVEVEKDAALALIRLHRAVGGSGVAAQIEKSGTTP